MFRLDETFSFSRDISVVLPSGEEQSFVCCFRLLDEDCFAQQLADDNDPDRALMQVAVTGWQDIQNAQGKPYPFSQQNLQNLLDLPFVKRALARAYVEGIKGSLEKN